MRDSPGMGTQSGRSEALADALGIVAIHQRPPGWVRDREAGLSLHGTEMNDSRWLAFPVSPSRGTTGIWQVCSKEHGTRLGEIRWFARWRQYVFCPAEATVFNAECLDDIRRFVIAKMTEWREERLGRRHGR